MPTTAALSSRPAAVLPRPGPARPAPAPSPAARPAPSPEEVAYLRQEVHRFEGVVREAKAALKQAEAARAHPPPIAAAGALAALEAQLRPAQDLLAFRLGALRATVLTAKPSGLLAAAQASGQADVERAGRALRRADDEAAGLSKRRAQLEARAQQRPGDAALQRQLEDVAAREAQALRDVRARGRDVQQLLLGVDNDTLARLESPLRGGEVPAPESTAHALQQVKALRAQVDLLRADVERAKAEQPRRLAGAVFNARAALTYAQDELARVKAELASLLR